MCTTSAIVRQSNKKTQANLKTDLFDLLNRLASEMRGYLYTCWLGIIQDPFTVAAATGAL
jgi:hypothetical protein